MARAAENKGKIIVGVNEEKCNGCGICETGGTGSFASAQLAIVFHPPPGLAGPYLLPQEGHIGNSEAYHRQGYQGGQVRPDKQKALAQG